MTDHLPECQRWFTDMPEPDECPACEMFRACEQRVLKAAWEAVKELEPLLGMEKYKGGYDCCGCSTPTSLYVDVIAALREVQP